MTMKPVEYTIDPIYEFEEQLNKITDPICYDIACKALQNAPNYFWYVPASSSGKYHPKCSLGVGGLVRHTKATFMVGDCLLEHPMVGSRFSELEKNKTRVAWLLHDSLKQGSEDTSKENHSQPNHPLLVRNYYKEIVNPDKKEEIYKLWDEICDLIETHMGCWTKDYQGNEILKAPETELQLFVHLGDYLASRNFLDIDTVTRQSQAKQASSDDWKNKPAKEGQIKYLDVLAKECIQKGIKISPVKIIDVEGNIVLKRGQASDIIQTWRNLLGKE